MLGKNFSSARGWSTGDAGGVGGPSAIYKTCQPKGYGFTFEITEGSDGVTPQMILVKESGERISVIKSTDWTYSSKGCLIVGSFPGGENHQRSIDFPINPRPKVSNAILAIA